MFAMIGALALGACGEKKPELDADDLPRTAAEYVALYNDWDGEKMAALHAKTPDLAEIQAELAWLHERLGDCGAPELMWKYKQTRGRFAAACERGELQISMRLDRKGRLVGTLNGGVGIELPEQVGKAMHEVVSAMPWTREAAGKQPWGKALRKGWARQLGRCELAAVRSVTDTTGRFDLRCENGSALLKLELGEDGSIAQVWLWPSDDDKTRAYKREMLG